MQNNLSTIKYIISSELQLALSSGTLPDSAYEKKNIEKNTPGIYIVVFRVLNNKDKHNVLIYNYVFILICLKYVYYII